MKDDPKSGIPDGIGGLGRKYDPKYEPSDEQKQLTKKEQERRRKMTEESVPFEVDVESEIPDHVALVGEGHNIARRILRSWAYYLPDDGEHNTAPSQTMPNQSLSVREIFKRFASGQPLSPRTDMVFTGDDPSPDLRQFDIEEIHEMQRANAENLERMRVALKAKSDERRQSLMREELAKQEAAKQADINAAVQAAVEDKTKKS